MNVNKISRRCALKMMATTAFAPPFLLSGCKQRQSTTSSSKSLIHMQQPWVNDAEFIGYFVAAARKYYVNEDIIVVNQVGGPDIVPEIRLNKHLAEIALTTPDNTLSLVTKQNIPLRIVGAQYHKSPMGIVTLVKSRISKPQDLVGKKIAVPSVNTLTFEAFLKINNIDPASVQIESYNYDPTPLVDGSVDATLDFVTNVEYTVDFLIEERVKSGKITKDSVANGGIKATSFLLADFGFEIMMDTVVVTDDYLRDNRDAIKKWLKASRMGWNDTFKNIDDCTKQYMTPFLSETKRTIEQEIAFNRKQQPLIENEKGIFFMSADSIRKTVTALNLIGIEAKSEMFDNSLVQEISQIL